MEYDEGRIHCGLIRNPARHLQIQMEGAAEVAAEYLAPLIRLSLAVGQGCGAPDDGG
jgi:hypothetical protein